MNMNTKKRGREGDEQANRNRLQDSENQIVKRVREEDDDGQGDSAILQQENPNRFQDSENQTLIKRGRDEYEDDDGEVEIEMANELIELSKSMESKGPRMFACKTCDRRFTSFQALGGHRASHNKPKLDHESSSLSSPPAKRKTHKCTLCGLEFQIGQALGGHMRKHRGVVNCLETRIAVPVPVMKRLASNKRVLGLDLDLNLNLQAPSNNQDLKREREVPFLYSFF